MIDKVNINIDAGKEEEGDEMDPLEQIQALKDSLGVNVDGLCEDIPQRTIDAYENARQYREWRLHHAAAHVEETSPPGLNPLGHVDIGPSEYDGLPAAWTLDPIRKRIVGIEDEDAIWTNENDVPLCPACGEQMQGGKIEDCTDQALGIVEKWYCQECRARADDHSAVTNIPVAIVLDDGTGEWTS